MKRKDPPALVGVVAALTVVVAVVMSVAVGVGLVATLIGR
jgi:hypothetical protein